jgi:iron complex transport system ATP-binding protein
VTIHSPPTRSVAQRPGLLSQQATPPGNITVEDLVRRGRYPHQRFFQPTRFAMSLVQDTPVMILDEPTAFLDFSAQIELPDIVLELNRDYGRTVVMVMHDLNLATRYAGHLIAMKRGKVIAEGPPEEFFTLDLIKQVFDIDANAIIDPLTGTPLTIPTRGSAARRDAKADQFAPPPFDGFALFDLDQPAGPVETAAAH